MYKWIKKKGYKTKLLASGVDMSCKGLEIQLVRFTSGKYRHYHKKKTEFFYFLKDGGLVYIEDKKYVITKGKMIIIKPNISHAFDASDTKYIEALNIKTNHNINDTFLKQVLDSE